MKHNINRALRLALIFIALIVLVMILFPSCIKT
jgi:hypothetical protein